MPFESSHVPPDRRNVVISVNPKAGASSADDRVARLAGLLREAGLEITVLSNLDRVASEANRLFAADMLRALVAVGGDGTAAELVNRTVPGVPLMVFPAGNENLLARYFDVGNSPEECFRTLVEGRIVRLDAGQAGNRIFLLMMSCGFDADVVHALHGDRIGHVNTASYIGPLMASLRRYDYPELRVYWSDVGAESIVAAGQAAAAGADEGVRWLFAFNLPCYGAGLQIAPEADGGDGLLDVCTFRHGGLLHGLLYTAAVLTGTHPQLTDFAQRRVRRFRVTSEGKVPYQLDGDPGGFLPVEIEILPQRLTLVVPKEYAIT